MKDIRTCKGNERKNNFPVLLINRRNPVLTLFVCCSHTSFSSALSPKSTSSIVRNRLRESNGLPLPILLESRFFEKTGFAFSLRVAIAICNENFVSELKLYILKPYFFLSKKINTRSAPFLEKSLFSPYPSSLRILFYIFWN